MLAKYDSLNNEFRPTEAQIQRRSSQTMVQRQLKRSEDLKVQSWGEGSLEHARDM